MGDPVSQLLSCPMASNQEFFPSGQQMTLPDAASFGRNVSVGNLQCGYPF